MQIGSIVEEMKNISRAIYGDFYSQHSDSPASEIPSDQPHIVIPRHFIDSINHYYELFSQAKKMIPRQRITNISQN